MKIIREITLDFARQGVQCTIPVTKNDVGILRLRIHLRNGSEPVHLSQGDMATLYIDNDAYDLVNVVYTDDSVFANTIEYELTGNVTSTVGEHSATLQVAGENGFASSPEFAFVVKESKGGESNVTNREPWAAIIGIKTQVEESKIEFDQKKENALSEFETKKSDVLSAIEKVKNEFVVQKIGDFENKVMSQKAVTDEFNRLPFKDETKPIQIAWNPIDKYRQPNGTYLDVAWNFEFKHPVNEGEKYIVNGSKYSTKCVYYTEDADGNIVQCIAYSGEYGAITGLAVTIGAGEVNIVLQANAEDRLLYSLTQVIGKGLNDKAVTKSMLSDDITKVFPNTAVVNLFNANDADVIEGQYLSTNGSFYELATMCVSGYIPIELNVEYEFPVYPNTFGESATQYVSYYNANKERIGASIGTVDTVTKMVKVTVTNAHARYIRVNFAKQGTYEIKVPAQNPQCFMVTKSPYPNGYIPYGELGIFAENMYLDTESERRNNPLFRRNAVFTGDSICNAASAGDGKSGWAGRIGNRNQMRWINRGISGATMTSGLSGSSGCIANTIFESDTDYIIIEGGTNDADIIGNALSSTPAAFGSFSLIDFGGEYDSATFCGAVESLLYRVTTENASAKVGFIIAQKMGQFNSTTLDYTAEHNNRRKYFEAIIQICKKWGVPVLNLWDDCYMNPYLHYSNTDDPMYTDGQHLTAKGYDFIAPIIENWMKTL